MAGDDFTTGTVPRVPVGTNYRVWWLWLPLIVGGLALLAAAVLLPVSPPLGIAAGLVAAGFTFWAIASALVIARGRRWLEYVDPLIRVISPHGAVEFTVDQVSDLAVFHVLHHAGGRLVAASREAHLWVESHAATGVVRLVNRLAPHGVDPLQELLDRLREQLIRQAVRRLARNETIQGGGWELTAGSLRITRGKQTHVLPLESVAAVDTLGQEVRIWQTGVPRAVVRLPLSGRNTWMIERLLTPAAMAKPAADSSHAAPSSAPPLGRILFERTASAAVSLLFGAIGLTISAAGVGTIVLSIRAVEPIGVVVGVMLALVGGLCVIGGLRVRQIRFCCHEHGLERVTMTGRQVLNYAEIDVFSFESRRNHSHGRYTGTTYTLVFADRSREQGRGIFFSTTVHNTDEELEMLRDRVSEHIGRRMAASFARNGRTQWTPDLRFHDEVLEFSRPRRLFAGPKLTVVPYDAVTDFDVRDGVFHVWTNYQERAVISVKTSSPNFYPGLLVFYSLVTAHLREPVDEWSPSAAAH